MRKRFLTTLALATGITFSAKANLAEAMEPFLNEWLEPAYPLIAGIIFLIGVFANLGKFTNAESRDIKGGIINIGVFLIVVVSIPVLYKIILTLTLK